METENQGELEPNRLRKDYRVKLPAKAKIQGVEYKVRDWSFEGFSVTGFPESDPQGHLYEAGYKVSVEFVLPFAAYNVNFNADAELRWRDKGEAGFDFTAIDSKTRNVMKEYVNAFVEGRLDSCEDVICRPRVETAVTSYETPLTPEEQERFGQKFKRHFGLYTLLGVILILLGVFLLYQHRYVFSTMALVRGNLVEVTSPVPGMIKNVNVKEGEKVSNGQLLFEVDDADLRNEADAARALLEKRKEVYRKTLGVIDEEKKKQQLYLTAAEQKEKMVKNQLDAVGADLSQAKVESERAKVLFAHDAINRAEMEGRESKYLQLSSKYKESEEELRLARQVIADAREGRFFSGMAIQGRAKELQRELADEDAMIKQTELLLQSTLDKLQKTKVESMRDGIANTYVRVKGDSVSAGDLVMTIEIPSQPWVVARYKLDDAQLIRPGDKAELFFPSLNLHTLGRVQAIGHDSLTSKGTPSVDLETSEQEIPVKIVLDHVPQGIRTGIRAEVRIRTRLYFGIIPKFFWGSVGSAKASTD